MLKDYNIKLTITTVSPIAIIENNDTMPNGNIVTRIKKTAIIYQESGQGQIDYIPYLPANGIRGLLRRLATKKLVDAVKENDKIEELKTTDLHAMLSGSGVSKSGLKFKEIEEIRGKNPILSLFGTGILIAGKLKVADAIPQNKEHAKELVRRQTFVKVDDILMGTKFSHLYTKKQIEEWEKSVEENSEARKKDRDARKSEKETNETSDEEQKTKKSSIQHFAQREYIASGATFNGGFFLEKVSKLELGMFLHTLEGFIEHGRLGSSQNIGFGVIDIHIEDISNSLTMDRSSDNDYIFNAELDVSLENEFEEAYMAYSEFLKKATKENIELISKF